MPRETLGRLAQSLGSGQDLVLLVGSTVLGLAQDSSDYDLYVVHLNEDVGWSRAPRLVSAAEVDRLVEVEDFGLGSVKAKTATIASYREQSALEVSRGVEQELLVRYSAFFGAEPIWDPAEAWFEVRQLLDPAPYRLVAMKWHAGWTTRLAATAAFALSIADLELADAAVRALAGHAIDGVLAEHGQLYFSPKYRFEKAQAGGLPVDVIEGYWALATPLFPLSRQGIRQRFAEAVNWAAGALDTDVSAEPMVPPRKCDAEVREMGGEFFVRRGRWCWCVGEVVSQVWDQLDEEVSLRVLTERWSGDEAQLGSILRKLTQAGLLQLPPKLGRWAMWI